MSNGNGHHWSKFCWRDWSADKALHPCSLAAKGFWIEMLCIMHEGTPIGHLTLGGKPATVRQMAANACCTEKDAKKYLAELEDAGVFSRTEDGTIYSRRMVKDAELSEASKAWGKTGGNPQLKTRRETEVPKPNGGVNPPNNLDLNPGHNSEVKFRVKPESDSDLEAERERVSKKILSLPSKDTVGSRARVETPQAAPSSADFNRYLDQLRSQSAAEIPEEKADPELVKAQVKRAVKAMEMRIPYGEVRSVEAQLAAIQEQPAAAGADVTMGLRWQPADPIRTPAEQLAAILSISLAEAQARLPARLHLPTPAPGPPMPQPLAPCGRSKGPYAARTPLAGISGGPSP